MRPGSRPQPLLGRPASSQDRQRQQKDLAALVARRAREQGEKKDEAFEEAAASKDESSLAARGGMPRATKVPTHAPRRATPRLCCPLVGLPN